jgi:hypothetical protein
MALPAAIGRRDQSTRRTRLIAEQSLLHQRRPVLLSPSRFTDGWGGNVMIA